ncbi:hypothetical protein IMCC26134_09275 [Verrucomicrobia bacterium IMCC26134]|nr:hypothetical protein IMCC26134_09275 [Verrucomicrobia bacterium IMCC26134]
MGKAAKPKDWPRQVRVGHACVKIYRIKQPRGKSGVTHVVAWLTPMGRHRRKIADEAAAMEEARLQANKLNAGRIESTQMSVNDHEELAALRLLAGDVPPLSALQEWKQAREISGGSLLTAVRFYVDHFSKSEAKSILVKDAVERFLKAKRAEGINVKASYEKILPRLRDGELGNLPIEVIGRDQLASWTLSAFAVEGKTEAHPETFNTARRRFVTLWRWGRDEGFLPKLARTAPEEIKTRKDVARDQEPIGIMSVPDWKASLVLIWNDAPRLLATLVIAGFCGMRRSELMAQRWADIDLKRGHLRVSKAKRRTPARRLVPICPAARAWLAICNQDGELIGPSWASDHVRARLREAKIPCPANALRHSFISYRCAASGSVDQTSQEAGNSPKIVFRHYRELVTPQQGKVWFGIKPASD